MESGPQIRLVELDDQEKLKDIDERYALEHDLEPLVNRSSLSFYQRSGHAFVAEVAGQPKGFVLAQSVWNGTRPTVFVSRLAVRDDADARTREALIGALVKSAVDAAVYDVEVHLPSSDAVGAETLKAQRHRKAATQVFRRILGSRGS